ncbi:hypothetical protein SAMN02745163_04176 [Clostridium cavendishii DSM 21758]|uniref:Uncharacterized protein n=1 Tax=Clostridium cavendishii DSM 21758 TaxID=1121302 RepID=A0A1M6U508_9CLOT|nr:hypothetical protein [Clostridium cavendishii]SHK64267.1 hypothetical protein SAMN02745163_04176 [Clostridium cavendishii DSM 21758]
MNIKKAIVKQNKNYKMFYTIMWALFFILPVAALLTGNTSMFIIIYLVFVEVLIVVSLFLISNNVKLKYSCSNNKLKMKLGWFGEEILLLCDKVVLVHTEKKLEDMEIVIVTSLKLRGDKLRPITKSFFKKHPLAAEEYKKIKIRYPDSKYTYMIIKKGALNKYNLLNDIYRNCVKATYTSKAIENIKIARCQKEI